jgi:hypothetical protein
MSRNESRSDLFDCEAQNEKSGGEFETISKVQILSATTKN